MQRHAVAELMVSTSQAAEELPAAGSNPAAHSTAHEVMQEQEQEKPNPTTTLLDPQPKHKMDQSKHKMDQSKPSKQMFSS
jgi:hypothetical protein